VKILQNMSLNYILMNVVIWCSYIHESLHIVYLASEQSYLMTCIKSHVTTFTTATVVSFPPVNLVVALDAELRAHRDETHPPGLLTLNTAMEPN
jgi:mannose/fructose/N-acetylgalactosamine-specific phosphotransferase system component IID